MTFRRLAGTGLEETGPPFRRAPWPRGSRRDAALLRDSPTARRVFVGQRDQRLRPDVALEGCDQPAMNRRRRCRPRRAAVHIARASRRTLFAQGSDEGGADLLFGEQAGDDRVPRRQDASRSRGRDPLLPRTLASSS